MNRIGVFSGGGSHGAEKVGVLYKEKPNYDKTYGCSTGALIAPLAALGEFERLKEAYLNVNNKRIYSVDPFNRNGKLSVTNAIWRLIRGKKSLGDSSKLLDTIRAYYTRKHHERIEDACTITRYNLAQQQVEHVNSGDVSWEEFTKAMWHSANAPVIMSYSDGMLDGGIVEVLPLSIAVANAKSGDAIDVYLCRKEGWDLRPITVGTALGFANAIISGMRKEIERNDLLLGISRAKRKKIKVVVDYQNKHVSGNALYFDRDTMQTYFNIGYYKQTPIKNDKDKVE